MLNLQHNRENALDWWFNKYHTENVQLSKKQILFNTFEDSLPLQM